MNQPNDSAGVAVQEKCRVFAYHSTKVLTLSVQFLEICLNENPQAQARINARFRAQGSNFARYAAGTLYRQAVRDYHCAQEHNYPFRSYDAAMKYEVAMNQDCYFSAYRDQYEFTGGVHGNTVRASDTFSLRNGRKFALSHFFAPGVNYRQLVTAEILKQAEKNVQNDPTVYFNNYKHLILKYFRDRKSTRLNSSH